jgi:hypothetical protein
MALSRRPLRPLIFPIGDKEYAVPPVDIDRGWAMTEIFQSTEAQLAKSKQDSSYLFRLAMTDEVWEQMRADGVPSHDAFRAGMAAVVHFQTLTANTGPDAADLAENAAEAVWESGIDPKAVMAYLTAQQPTNRSTRRAAARTTKTPASGAGTPRKRTATKAVPPSRGRSSKPSGR